MIHFQTYEEFKSTSVSLDIHGRLNCVLRGSLFIRGLTFNCTICKAGELLQMTVNQLTGSWPSSGKPFRVGGT